MDVSLLKVKRLKVKSMKVKCMEVKAMKVNQMDVKDVFIGKLSRLIFRSAEHFSQISVVAFVLCFMSACSHFSGGMEKPRMQLVDFDVVSAEGFAPRFAVTIEVSNPNSFDLKVKGASYSLGLQGFDLIEGVSNRLPVVPAYGSEIVRLEARANLVESYKFFRSVMNEGADNVAYHMSLKLDSGGLFSSVYLEDEGRIDLSELKQ